MKGEEVKERRREAVEDERVSGRGGRPLGSSPAGTGRGACSRERGAEAAGGVAVARTIVTKS